MPHIRVRNADIHYRTGKDAPAIGDIPLLFIHGAGGNGRVWEGALRHLSRCCYPMAIDLPGHGRSGGTGERTIEGYVEVVKGMIDDLNLGPFVVAGHSMGGGIAQALALKHPESLKGVILVGTGARLRVHPSILEGLERATEGEDRAPLAEWAYSPATDPATIERTEALFKDTPPSVTRGDMLACDAFDVMDRIGEISLPTLVVCGNDDRLTPVKYAHYLADRIKGSTLKIIEGAGHMVMVERPDHFNTAVEDFIRGAASPSRG